VTSKRTPFVVDGGAPSGPAEPIRQYISVGIGPIAFVGARLLSLELYMRTQEAKADRRLWSQYEWLSGLAAAWESCFVNHDGSRPRYAVDHFIRRTAAATARGVLIDQALASAEARILGKLRDGR
jgi:hypothetical protein